MNNKLKDFWLRLEDAAGLKDNPATFDSLVAGLELY